MISPRALLFFLLLPLVFRPTTAVAGDDTSNFRESVFACEEAAAKLDACCPGFDPRAIRCHYVQRYSGCESAIDEGEHPAFDGAESRCIVAASCDELVARGICERAASAAPDRWYTWHAGYDKELGSSSFQPPVCP